MIRRTLGILLLGNGNGVQGLGAGVISVAHGSKRHGTSLPSHEGLSACRSQRAHVVFPDPSSAEQNRCGRVQGTAGKCLVASAASRFIYSSHKEEFSRGPAQARRTRFAYEWSGRRSILEGLW